MRDDDHSRQCGNSSASTARAVAIHHTAGPNSYSTASQAMAQLRSDYPQGREGYLTWRRDQGRRHAERVMGIMREAGFAETEVEAAGRMLRKEGIKRDPEVQALEDIACFTFIRHYLGDFGATQDAGALLGIVQKTARKMSPAARDRALAEFPMPAAFATAFREAGPR